MSKRSRSQRDSTAAVVGPDIAPELYAERDTGYNVPQDLILAPKEKKPALTKAEKAKAHALANAPIPSRTERRLSKSQQKKLDRLEASQCDAILLQWTLFGSLFRIILLTCSWTEKKKHDG
jgi:hypothetical protein